MTTKSTRRNPKWRNSQFLSGSTQPATSISRVIAQPLQGSPLRSAIDGLPSVSNSSDAGSLYSVNEMSRKHERNEEATAGETDPQKTAVEDPGLNKLHRVASAPPADLEGHGDQEVTETDSVDSTASKPTPLVESAPTADTLVVIPDPPANMPFPSASPTTTAKLDSTSTSPKVSWFNSLSFARGKDIQRQTNGAEGVALDMKAVESPSSSPQQIAETSPSSPPLQRPDCARANSDPNSVISSVDDEVHLAKVLSAADCANAHVDPIHASVEPTHPSGEEERERTLSVSSLNPSTSRFMLRMPLLGRPKIPLEQVVRADRENKKPITVYMKETDEASSHADANKDVGSIPNVTISSPQPSSETLSHPQSQSQDNSNDISMTESPSSPHNDENLPSTDNRQAPTVPQAVSTSSSWWGYLGWSDSDTQGDPISAAVQDGHLGHDSGNAPSQASQSEGLEETTEQSKPVPEDHINVGRNEVAAALPEAVSKIEDPSSPTVKTTPDIGNTKPASLFSAETILSQGSAWYSPWGWYATSPVVPSSPSAKKAEQLEDAHEYEHSKTESEMVKEEALAREDLPTSEPNTTHQTQATLSPSEEVTLKPSSPSSLLNPIESSISTQRSGWASFFMSNTLLTKTITNESHERDENGMEVMEVDEREDKEETPKPDERQAVPSQAMMIVAGKKRQATSLPSSPTSKSPPSRPQTSKERELKKSGPPAPPLTNSETIKKETANPTMARSSSPTPSGKSGTSTPGGPNAHPPNLVLPTWKDTFLSAPRSNMPPPPTPPATQKGKLGKTFDFVSGVLFSGSKGDERAHGSVKARGKQKERNREQEFLLFGNELPKALDITDQTFNPEVLNEKCRVVVIGVAGWSPGAVIRTIAGGLPSSSSKFVDMSCSALEKFEEDHGFKFKKITKIPLEGDGTIERKVAKVHTHLLGNEQWVDDLHAADVIFVATHSQGSIVATHLLDKLIREGHILTPRNVDTLSSTAAAIVPGGSVPLPASLTRTQKICCLALCGIHLGPLRYLKTSSLLQPYIQYFENAAAGELFDFQNTETPVSQNYVKALRTVMDHGTKMVYVASLNDQVVPIYSGLFTAASHPRILRALYIDGDAYHSSDFLSNLLVLLIRIMNSGLSDSGLLAHLSEATAGTLSGVGHSTAYEEPATYSLAVDYLFLTTDGTDERTDLVVEGFNAVNEQNDYEIPWSLRDLIADDRVAHFFADEFSRLRNAFDDWSPKTTILRDIKRKLQPIQRLSSIRGTPLTSRL